jgi:dTDP-4-amino-4,6-dideoxygalactose transaminase
MNAGFPEAPVPNKSRCGDEEEFVGSRFLARHLLELPVHEDLQEVHLDKVIDLLASIMDEGTMEN